MSWLDETLGINMPSLGDDPGQPMLGLQPSIAAGQDYTPSFDMQGAQPGIGLAPSPDPRFGMETEGTVTQTGNSPMAGGGIGMAQQTNDMMAPRAQPKTGLKDQNWLTKIGLILEAAGAGAPAGPPTGTGTASSESATSA